MKWLAPTRLGLLAFFFAASVFGQSGNEGSIEGFVIDPSGAVIFGVNVTARNIDTAAIYRAVTDGDGRFRFLVLPVGTYEVTAEHPGFATLVDKDVVVTVGAKVNLPLTLPLASQSQRVEVSSETPLLESTRTHVSSTIDERSIANLPVNGRNFNDFIVLAPGVIRGPVLMNFGSGIPSVGGQRSFSMTLVDGAENAPAFSAPFGPGIQPYQFSLEVVREFQVNTNSYSAELGHAGNGLISIVTKSGTNDLHGSLFWYFRDKGLNATDLIRKINSQPKEPLHVHQFGAAVGGPILRNKLFFFAGYDAQRRQLQNLILLNLPAGLSLSPDPTVAGFQQRALDYLTPRAASYIQTYDQDVYMAKVDWRIKSTQLFSARWNTQHFTGENSFAAGPQLSLENNTGSLTTNHSLVLSLTSAISSAMVNVARFGSLLNNDKGRPNSVNPQANIFETSQQVLTVGRGGNGQRTLVRQFEWSDTLSMSRGGHVFKFGGDVLRARNRQENAPNFFGNYRFMSLESFGRSLAQLPVCNPSQNPAPASCRTPLPNETYIQGFSGEGKPGVITLPNSTEFAGFLQDDWRARSDLSFSLGLRYDIEVMAKPPVKNPSSALAAANLDTSFVPLDANNFAPRLGFAWTPLRSQRLVVRGGYGLFIARLQDIIAGRAHTQNGVSVETRTFTGASIPAYPNTLCGPTDPSGLPPSCPPPIGGSDSLMLFSPNYVQPYDQQASLGIEYQLRDNWAISTSYLMVKGTHLPRWRDFNLSAPTPANIGIAGTNAVLTYQRFSGTTSTSPASRPIPGFDRIFLLASEANSTYHGMAVQLNKRFAHDFQFLGGYTLGRVIDDRPEAINFNPGGPNDALLLSDSFNPVADRGPGAEDVRHRFVLSGFWDLNYANRLPKTGKALLGGWELSGILAVQSGLPYSGLVNFDLNNDGNSQTDRTPGQPRNTFRQPTTVSIDPRVTRNVAIKERLRLQFICEAFNVLNRANITDLRTTQYARSSPSPTAVAICKPAAVPCLIPQNTGTTAFGAPAATLGPRIMQLALKLLF